MLDLERAIDDFDNFHTNLCGDLRESWQRIKEHIEAQNTAHNTLRDSILLLEECHQELKICKKWPLVPKDCMCLHCQVERFIAQNGTRL